MDARRRDLRAVFPALMTAVQWALIALAAGGSLVACVAVVPYRPDTEYARGLEAAEVQARFGQAMTGMVSPRILSARINEHYYEYEIETASWNVHGIPTGTTSRKVQRDFTEVDRARLHENHVVYVFSKDGRLLDHLRFAGQEDAKVFIDLVMSYRDRLMNAWSGRR